MSTGTVTLCEFDDDHIKGIAVGPTQEDVIVTAQEDGVFLHSSVLKEPKQAWSLSSSTLELSHAAAWDARTQHFYAVSSVRPGATKVAAGPGQRLLGWPADFKQPLEDAPVSLELASAVHAVHPIFPAAAAGSGSADEQEEGQKAGSEQHNSSASQRKLAEETAATPQKHKGGERSSQQGGALMHTKLPSIRTRLKQRPGKRKPAAATSLMQLPWMQDWIATGRTAQDRKAAEEHEAAGASTSGRSTLDMGHAQQGIPGVFIVHGDGSVALDVAYSRHREKETNGSADAQALTSAAADGRLAVVTRGKKRRQCLHLYTLQGNALHQCGEFHLQPPEKGAEAASVDLSEHRLVLLWSNGVLQAFSQQAAPKAQMTLKMQYQRKLAGFPEVFAERLKQTPSKRTGSAAAPTSAQPAKHSRPSCTFCGNGLIAVAASIYPNDSSKGAAAGGEEAQSDLLAPTKANHNSTDQRSLNGPISPLKERSNGVGANGLLPPSRQLKQGVLRVVVLDDTYGCVQHVKDLPRADLSPELDDPFSAPAQPQHMQVLSQRQGSLLTLVVRLQSRVLLLRIQTEPVTLGGMVGALSLNRQQHPTAALQAQALDLSQHVQQAPVHSHFRPCWAQRGAAIGLPMLPHIGQVAVEVPTQKLSRWQAASDAVAADCRPEQEALQRLRQPGGLPSAEVARTLVHDITQRTQEHGAGDVSQELLQLIAERCSAAGYWDVLHLLAQHPQLPAFAGLQTVLPRLAEHGQYLSLACALAQAKDISPAHLGETLRVLLGQVSAEEQEGFKQWSAHIASTADAAVQEAEASSGMEGAHEAALARAQAVVMVTDGFTAREVCMHAALAAGHDQAVLHAALRRLQQPQVARLITYLLKWVTRHPAGGQANGVGSIAPGLVLPPMEAVLKWACATLDTHFITLAGLPADVQQALLTLRERIQETLQLSQGIVALSGALEHIHSQAPLPAFSSANPQQYFVELLDLGVRAA